MQELFDYQIAKNNKEVLDMLNVKYIIQQNDKGEEVASLNPGANGNAWFVTKILSVNSNDEEMKALTKFDSKNVAIKLRDKEDKSFEIKMPFSVDSLAAIKLNVYKPNYLKYTSNNLKFGFAVFSEMYYKDGWNATVDGKAAEIVRVDYTLRGLNIPAGKHIIEFKFEPQVVKTGSAIALVSNMGMVLLVVGWIYFKRKRS
jgi:uncharacterized membrane protein YfhO